MAADSVKIIINKKINKLAYLKNGVVVKIFPVATGRLQGLTPEGTFKVVRKLVKPAYNKLKIPGGSPKNPLGARWLGFNARGTSGGTYGIHGTNNPGSIGKYRSGGCIRMFNQDVIWLYNNTALNTPVEIINRDWDLQLKPVKVIINGSILAADTESLPYMANDRVMVPCRLVAELMGFKVGWDAEHQAATLKNGNTTISLRPNSTTISINGEEVRTDTAPVMKNGKIFVWVRNLAEPVDYQIGWDYNTYTVTLTKPDRQ